MNIGNFSNSKIGSNENHNFVSSINKSKYVYVIKKIKQKIKKQK